jgi:hypothetical protein
MTPPRRPEDAQALLDAAVRVLLKFTDSGTPFAISNNSLRAMTEILSRRLLNLEPGRALALLSLWERRAAAIRDDLLPNAVTVSFRDGGQLPLFTEDSAGRMGSICPDKPEF